MVDNDNHNLRRRMEAQEQTSKAQQEALNPINASSTPLQPE